MDYTVIYPSGQQQKFYVRAVAEMYAKINKGRVVGQPELKLVAQKAA